MRKELSAETKKKLYLFSTIVWFINTGIWTAAICVDLYYGYSPEGLTILRVFCVLASLFAAIANLLQYRRAKEEEKNLRRDTSGCNPT